MEMRYVHVSILPIGTTHKAASQAQMRGSEPGLIYLKGCSFGVSCTIVREYGKEISD